MNKLDKEDTRHLIVALGLVGAIIIACSVLWYTGRLYDIIAWMYEIFKGRDELREYVESWGSWAPLAFVTIQSLQVVMAPIPGELSGVVGGFVFGAGLNVIYSTVGLTIGSVIAFAGGRIIGLPLVKLVVPEEYLKKFQFLTERRGTLLTLALFTFPGFPKDILCYLLGLSPMGYAMFFVVSTVGRIPGTVMLSFFGDAVYEENWTLLIVLAAICLVTMGIVFLGRDKIDQWLVRRHASKVAQGAEDAPPQPETASPGTSGN